MKQRTSVFMAIAMAVIVAAGAGSAEAAPSSGAAPSDSHTTAYLGVHIDDLTPQLAATLKVNESGGVVIADVDQDGPACHAGLKENDVVVAFNGSKVENADQLGNLIHATAPGKVVNLTVVRNGEKKDIKVTLGAWPRTMARMQTFSSGAPMSFPGPAAFPHPVVPDFEVPSFATLSSHHGVVVETLSPQLSEFFGVPGGRGVLVRSVEGGSPAAAAGLKAGDVIVRVNNEQVHDMADWRRGMQMHASKISLLILRDKREQTVVINLPPPSSSELEGQQDFEHGMQALREEMKKLGPEIERSQKEALLAMKPRDEELNQMRREIEKSMKLQQKDIDKARREAEKAARPTKEQMDEISREIQRSMPSAKELEQMRSQMKLTQAQMEEMKRGIQKAMPSEKDMEQMRRDIEDSMKDWTEQQRQPN